MFNPILQYELSKKKVITPSSTLLDGVIHYFKFDNATGTSTTDLLSSEVINYNGAEIRAGKIGKGIDVASGDYPRTTGTSSFNFAKANPFTISLWFKPGALSGTRILFDKQQGSGPRRGFEITLINSGDVSIQVFGNGTTNWINNSYTGGISTTTWHHIVVTYDGSGSGTGINLYVNSFVKSRTVLTDNLSTFDFNVSAPVTVGAHFDNTFPALGEFDELSGWNRVLSQNEINQLYNGGIGNQHPFITPPPPSTLLNGITNYFKFDDASGTSSTDTLTSEVINYNGAAIVAGKINNGIDVQTGDYPRTSGTNTFNFSKANPFTLSFWLKPSSGQSAAYKFLMAKQGGSPIKGYEIMIENSTTMYVTLLGNGTINWIRVTFPSGITFDSTTWHHIVITYDGSASANGINYYLNSVAKTRTVLANNLSSYDFNSTAPLTFGSNAANTLPIFGALDELSGWNRVLSQNEINELYNSGLGKQHPFTP